MAIFKCKMCGGDLVLTEDCTVAECEYCGTRQTVPASDSEKKMNLFNRANRLRMNSEFDKAASLYENIVAEFPEEAEAYWGLCLCNYGIEYVDDPLTARKIPTCHRASFTSIQSDENFSLALEYADVSAQKVYRDEAKEIDRIMQEILAVSKNEKPYDIFICYKETDEHGARTPDSVMAQDVYDALIAKGFKVFFSRISLEDKLGRQYEPYIFAALNSAKVMLSFGTKYENFHAVWVKNEWSRFLKLMAKDKSKLLIPCFKDIDPYDMPEEFKNLQAQDMGKLGAIQDLVRGVEKIIGIEKQDATVVNVAAGNVDSLLKRAYMFIDDKNWKSADEYCEKVLDIDPENAEAYLGKLLVEYKVDNKKSLRNAKTSFENSNNFKKLKLFADESLVEELTEYIAFINNRNREETNAAVYNDAVNKMKSARTQQQFCDAEKLFRQISGWKDSAKLADECSEKAETARKENIYNTALRAMASDDIAQIESAKRAFQSISGWRDADEKVAQCDSLMNRAKNNKAIKKIIIIPIVIGVLIVLIAGITIFRKTNAPDVAINSSVTTTMSGNVSGGSNNSNSGANNNVNTPTESENQYNLAITLMSMLKYDDALEIFTQLGDYKDSKDKIDECKNKIETIEKLAPMMRNENRISAEGICTIGLKSDGTVITTSYTRDWTDIIAVTGNLGLKSDGTVVATGYNYYGQYDVSDWTDIIAVSAGGWHTVGLKSDGTVVATGLNGVGQCNVSDWRNIVAIAVEDDLTVGLKSDGTVVTTGSDYDVVDGVSKWKDIVAVSTGCSQLAALPTRHVVGLKSDGTVVATGYESGYNYSGQCDVSGWRNIVAIAAGDDHTVGLRSDGTVVATGNNRNGQCDVSDWTDIIAISAGSYHTVGLKSDGTVVAVGAKNHAHGQCDVSDWVLF